MWLLFILAGLLAVSAEKETVSNVAEKSSSSPTASADDIVMLEIDVKEPAKRSPISANGIYGSSPSQYVIRHGDDAQELSPEYLSVLQQYSQSQSQAYGPTTAAPPPQRRPLPAYARQQQQLQQAYHNFRKPTVVPPRPRAQLHPQALAQAEATAQLHAQIEARNRAEAIHTARLNPSGTSTYQVAAYSEPKLGTFEQELLQLVSANQAQEFKLVPTQPKSALKSGYASEYSQQLQQQPAPAYQSVEEPVQIQYQPVQSLPVQTKEFRPSPQYQYAEDHGNLKAQAEAEAIARAQAQAQAQALAFQKVAQAAHNKHQQEAFQQIQIVNERHRQQSALEQIQQGTQISDAGRAHIEEQYHPKNPEAAYRARLKAQAQAELAEARRAQEAAEYKAHSDAILKLQAQQQAHLKAQEEAHRNALNFEKNQLQAQAQAQALAQAQAEALYKAHQQTRAKANSEVVAVARAQAEARKQDPENTPVVQYLLPNSTPLPSPNSYYTSDEVQKYQASGSSYVPRSVPKDEGPSSIAEELQPTITQPRQTHKLKIPTASPSSVYVSQSGLLKKAPIKSLTIEEIIDQDQINGPQVVRIPTSKGHQTLTQEDLSALIHSGYSVTPIPQTVKPTQQTYIGENSSAGYYIKKQRNPVGRPEYITYEDAIPQGRKAIRKNRPILKPQGSEAEASEKVTYLIPLEPEFGNKQQPLVRRSQE
ncbi:mediator of RNA polymerase II transcription subunit 15-like isoform X1 [Vespa mandarinia]|uniref:mediator of RNA polymerase II transcription subunit 15-like isoform X1 n=1 Tax=Vespa mandarinia TaxID=7446 RepID=UPI0016150CE7|nr:mediator of RNA polymerase II transcription subunit 15-like isoform X1 [Vespa mandarinia]